VTEPVKTIQGPRGTTNITPKQKVVDMGVKKKKRRKRGK